MTSNETPTQAASLVARIKGHEDDELDVKRVDAGPVKRFFIHILTRDVELNDAILDLVDNSIDSATKLRASGSKEPIVIDIVANKDTFSIADNCAGISVEAAVQYAFRLGRPGDEDVKADEEASEGGLDPQASREAVSGQPRSIGQFGVGMKRSLFKMGSDFTVSSATQETFFDMHLNVPKWIDKANDWTINVKVHQLAKSDLPPRGTTIVIHELLPSVSSALATLVNSNRLKEDLRSKHRMAIERGVKILLNTEELTAEPTVLAVSPDSDRLLQPLVESFKLTDHAGRVIDVKIYAGIAAQTETKSDDEPEAVKEAERSAGWYVFGNDRLLMGPDRTPVTGWAGGGAGLPLYHNQYNRFRGYVYMNAEDSQALPWNTTKTGVETSDPVWTSVRGEMLKAGHRVVVALNQLKKEKEAEGEGLDLPLTVALKSAKNQTVSDVSRSTDGQKLLYPDRNPEIGKSKGHRIAYVVDEEHFVAVAASTDETTGAGVGRATFDYYYSQFVEEA